MQLPPGRCEIGESKLLDKSYPLAQKISLIDSGHYANWAFSDSHPTQGRRFTKAAQRLQEVTLGLGLGLTVIDSDFKPAPELFEYAHDPAYLNEVLKQGISGEWDGPRPDLARIAHLMAGGTLLATESLLRQHAEIAVHFAGAKHHAHYDHSSGFCVFNDFAIAAQHALRSPREIHDSRSGVPKVVERIAILDIDAHHGDGTEALLGSNRQVLTFSVHDSTIFPGTGFDSHPENHIYNRPLEYQAGDRELQSATQEFTDIAGSFEPDLIFIAMGADGLVQDPLSSLQYTFVGLEEAVRHVRRKFPHAPLLLGGAGGYRPDDATPEAWVRMVIAAATA